MSFKYAKVSFKNRITQKKSDILWAMLGNAWKCILKCVSWFVSVILNFNALCDAYTVQRLYRVTAVRIVSTLRD